jgi:L-lactate dehydrogenase complex protein LldE
MTDNSARKRIEPRPAAAALFVTCLVDQFKPGVGDAVVDVLDSLRVKVDVPNDQTCCGQPAFNSGFRKEARVVASRFLDIFDNPPNPGESPMPIVSPSGSCTAMVRNYYPVLFRDDPAELERTKRVSNRLWEFSEFIVDGLGSTGFEHASPVDQSPSETEPPASATYHRCCHALRELGIDWQPEELINAVDGVDLKPLERSEVCCGFGGAFSVKMPDISTAMLDEKLDNVESTGAARLIAGDAGCIMHMEGGLRRRGSNVQVLHIAELLAESLRAGQAHSMITESVVTSVESPADTVRSEPPEPAHPDHEKPAKPAG